MIIKGHDCSMNIYVRHLRAPQSLSLSEGDGERQVAAEMERV